MKVAVPVEKTGLVPIATMNSVLQQMVQMPWRSVVARKGITFSHFKLKHGWCY